MSITRQTANALSAEAFEALQKVAAQHGMALQRESGRLSDTSFTFKVQTASGVPADYALHARLIGIPEDSYGKTFTVRGTRYTITGIKLSRRKYPVSPLQEPLSPPGTGALVVLDQTADQFVVQTDPPCRTIQCRADLLSDPGQGLCQQKSTVPPGSNSTSLPYYRSGGQTP